MGASKQLAAGVKVPAPELSATVPVGAIKPGATGKGVVSPSATVAVQVAICRSLSSTGVQAIVVAPAWGKELISRPNGLDAPVMKLSFTALPSRLARPIVSRLKLVQ